MSHEHKNKHSDANSHIDETAKDKEGAHKTHYQNIKITKLPHSELEIEGEIEAEEMERARAKALKGLGQQAAFDGFRKGHVPEAVLIAKLGEMAIMEEAAEIVLGHEYQHIVIDNKIDVIARPQITLTKIARGNPLGFKIRVSVFPEFNLPDYRKIALKTLAEIDKERKNEDLVVSDKELNDVIDDIRKSVAKQKQDRKNQDSVNQDSENQNTPLSTESELPLPDLTDEFIKTLGNFADVADFKKKISENLLKEKESRAAEKKRIKIGEQLVEATKIDLPEILVENELNKMAAQFNGDIERMGFKLEDYLKHINKTKEEMREDWRKDAEKRAILQMIFNKIAFEEKLLPGEKEIETEAKHMMEHYKDTDPERIRAYIETMLANESVFRFLETQK
jgi:trigger factor